MVAELAPAWDRACNTKLFADTAAGKRPPLDHWRAAVAQFFVIVENFPKYMALTLAKTTYGVRPGDSTVRRWLLQNMAIEARHAEWYIDWMRSIELEPQNVFERARTPEIMALDAHLWECCRHGSLAEGVAATNWAIEGITGDWTKAVLQPFRDYEADGAIIDSEGMMWLKAHARYDDAHPEEALEILKLYVDAPRDEAKRIEDAARTSLVLFRTAMDRIWERCESTSRPA
jgi:pyrroloquinoline quinone (PQQ) biosynthesis protein C